MDEKEFNWMVIDSYSLLLNKYENYINKEKIDSLKGDLLTTEEAYQLYVGALLGINYDDRKALFNIYVKSVIKEQNIIIYKTNPYYQNIKFNNIVYKDWKLGYEEYKEYEPFVYDDLKEIDGKVIPSIGYFKEKFKYPAIYQGDRLWMSVCPNEINTMDSDIKEANGNVLVYGLGLGYYPYMVSLIKKAKSITIVEKDKNVITVFKKYIYPQFNDVYIKIINMDALEFGATISKDDYDFVYCDLWHDPTDGVELYNKLKKLEKPGITYRYWIEKTLKYYL